MTGDGISTDLSLATLESFDAGGTAFVFGSTGGIGSSLVEAIEASGRFAAVHGFSRNGKTPVDVLDEASIAAAAEFADACGEVRLIVDATGFLHDDKGAPEKSWRDLSADGLARAFAVNAIGPALIMKHFLPLLPRKGKSLFATLSARVGSIGDNQIGGWYGYRSSKAALNQLTRTAAIELGRRHRAAVCVALHPGTVATDLSEPFSKRGLDVQEPADAAARLLHVIDGLAADNSGGFFDHHGKPVPW